MKYSVKMIVKTVQVEAESEEDARYQAWDIVAGEPSLFVKATAKVKASGSR